MQLSKIDRERNPSHHNIPLQYDRLAIIPAGGGTIVWCQYTTTV